MGINGQEKDVELAAGMYTAEYWEYDARIGRRWNTDPVVKPWESPYACFANNPIYYADPSGLDGEGPNGECPGDSRDCGGGYSEIYGYNAITKQWEWTQYSSEGAVDINSNLNPVPKDFLTSERAKNYLKNSGLDPNKVSIKHVPWNMDSKKAEIYQTMVFGSMYDMFYDGQPIGSFQYTTGPVWMSQINTDISAKLTDVEFKDLDELIKGWPGGEGINMPKMAAEDQVNDKGADASYPRFDVLNKAKGVKFATVNLNSKKNTYNSFLSQTGLKSNSSTSKLYQQYKSTGILIYQNGKPVLKITTKFEIREAIMSGLEPAEQKAYDKLQDEAQDK